MRRAGETLAQGTPFLQGQDSSVESLALPWPLLIPWPLWDAGCECELQPCDLTQLHITAFQPPQMFCFPPRGGVTWDCVKTQLSEAAHQTWLCLQETTVAFLNWAFAMIPQQ